MNPFDASSRVNYFVVPEFIGQGLPCALCLLTGHWIMFLLTLPLACYHANLETQASTRLLFSRFLSEITWHVKILHQIISSNIKAHIDTIKVELSALKLHAW
ncbi:uncharacterized protein DS421_6g173170 [Arachis hypogaea]|nr:uncharacterized protein DS421_6g173170 [Arachis hypogaea]